MVERRTFFQYFIEILKQTLYNFYETFKCFLKHNEEMWLLLLRMQTVRITNSFCDRGTAPENTLYLIKLHCNNKFLDIVIRWSKMIHMKMHHKVSYSIFLYFCIIFTPSANMCADNRFSVYPCMIAWQECIYRLHKYSTIVNVKKRILFNTHVVRSIWITNVYDILFTTSFTSIYHSLQNIYFYRIHSFWEITILVTYPKFRIASLLRKDFLMMQLLLILRSSFHCVKRRLLHDTN